jgi:hypothetical protein
MDRSLIETFAAGGETLRRAVAGLTPEQWRARPGPGAWSTLEVVVHLADSDAIAIDRMKRVLIEDEPPLLYADETAYVERLFTHDQDPDDALALFEIGRRQWARVLRKLPDAAFERRGVHNRKGPVTLGGMIATFVGHLDSHLTYIRDKRANLGTPLPAGARPGEGGG